MLTSNGVVLLQLELIGVVLRILLGHVEKAGVCRADQFDIVLCFSHVFNPKFCAARAVKPRPLFIRAIRGAMS